MNFHILTLFPDMVMQGLLTSITGRAVKQNKIAVEAVDIRDYTRDKHRKVDDYPYGGGAGMLMQAQPVYDAYQSVADRIPADSPQRVIYVTPQGKPFTQRMAEEFSQSSDLILLCGHYEGIDERVLEEVVTDYVSIGDYVLTGGELAAMVIVDAVARLVPGVLNNEDSAETESFHGDLLEYPQYSRPEIWHGKQVPEVLLSGNRKKIRAWRLEESVQRTRERRPDLYACYQRLMECRELMMRQKLLHIDMIELINRGRAELVYYRDGEILLKDRASGAFFFTVCRERDGAAETDGETAPRFLAELPEEILAEIKSMTVHQEAFAAPITERLPIRMRMKCVQAVYTRKEKLPVSGLYRQDGEELPNGLCIRLLTEEYQELAAAAYSSYDHPGYIQERIAKGCVYGAFSHGRLAGFAGIHAEGSLGMLEVLPEYQRQHIGKALETYLVNWALEQGWIPYGQVQEGDACCIAMQERLGLYCSREPVFRLE